MQGRVVVTVILALSLLWTIGPVADESLAADLSLKKFESYLAQSQARFKTVKADLAKMNILDRGLENKISQLVPGLELRFEKAGQATAAERSKTWRKLKYLMRDLEKHYLQAKIEIAREKGDQGTVKSLEKQRQDLVGRINYDYRTGAKLKSYKGQIGVLKNEAVGKKNPPTEEWDQMMTYFQAAHQAAEVEYEAFLEAGEAEWEGLRPSLDKAMKKVDESYKKVKAEFKKF